MGQIYALLAVFLFIVSHAQVKILSHFPVEQVVFIRAFGILIFSLPLMYFLKIDFLGNDRKNLFLRGAFGTVAIFCYFSTLQNLPLPTAVVLAQLAPFFAVFFASFILKEKNTVLVYLLFSVALFGVYLIKSARFDFSIYYVLGIVGAAFAALAYNFVRKLKTSDHPLVVLTWFQFVLFPVSLLALLRSGVVTPKNSDFLPIFLIGLFSFLAQVCLTLAYQKAKMSKSSSVNFLSIPLSVLVAYFFFNETLSRVQFLGIGIVFIAVSVNALFLGRFKRFIAPK